MFLSESASLFFFWWYYFEVQLCCQAKEEEKKPSKDKALKQQSALIAVLAMTPHSFLSSPTHSINLFSVLLQCTHLSSSTFCPVTVAKNGRPYLDLPLPPHYFSFCPSQTDTSNYFAMCPFFSPLHLPLEPLWTLEVTYLNSFSSHPRWAQKDIKPELFIMI